MIAKLLVGIGIVLGSQELWAHGMNKLGPNKGFIQMPGAFHTELIVKGEALKVWLLDVNFKDPQVSDSAVELSVVRGDMVLQKEACPAEENHFSCPLKANVKLKKGDKVVVKANRGQAKGGDAVYLFPFKVSNH